MDDYAQIERSRPSESQQNDFTPLLEREHLYQGKRNQTEGRTISESVLPRMTLTGDVRPSTSSAPSILNPIDSGRGESNQPHDSLAKHNPNDRIPRSAEELMKEKIARQGAVVNRDANGAIDEIYAVNKSGKVEHWVRVKAEGGKQAWVCDYDNRSKEDVIKASAAAEKALSHGQYLSRKQQRDLPVESKVSVDPNNTICIKTEFSPDGKSKYEIEHHIRTDGKRVTPPARKK